jgi:AcrR family transcriptional regulator
MTIKQERKQKTVNRILQTAARVFAESGFEGARMDGIAERANINKALIYYHIGDKMALYTRVLHEIFGDVADRMAQNISQATTPREKISAYISSIRQTLKKHPHLPTIMMHELAAGGRNLPDIVADDLVAIIGLISSAVWEGRQQGEFQDVDPFILHLMVIGGISYFKTSGGLRQRHASLVDDRTTELADKDDTQLLDEIERIILGALNGC